MRRRSATLRLVFALCAIVTFTILNSKASGQDADYEKAVAHATQIIKTKILPKYEIKDGFNVKPMDIKYDRDPTIARYLDEFGSIWKQLDPVVASGYTVIQRKVNEETRPDANRIRGPLAAAFDQAIELRGGGSASAKLYWFAPAQQEWIIAHLETGKADHVPDQKFVSRLMNDLTVGGGVPPRREVERVLDKLKAVERLLDKRQAAFLREQFFSYFK